MAVEISSSLAETIAKAFVSGVETSIQALSELLGLDETSKLVAARGVANFVDQLKLELVPNHLEGEFGTTRVLRSASFSEDPAGRVRDLINCGEGPSIEFKSSMLCSVRDWNRDGKLVEFPSLPGEILKTVCAFLNSEGGDLLVGVDDDGVTCDGLRLDLELKKWNLDKWQLHFRTLIDGRFHDGAQIHSYIRTTMLELDSENVFHVAVMPRQTRSFVRREKNQPYEFFMRNGPRTDSLDLPSFYSHMVLASKK